MKSKNNNDHTIVNKIKKELDDHEFGSIESDWAKMQKKLTQEDSNRLFKSSFIWSFIQRKRIVISIAASLILLVGFFYCFIKIKHKSIALDSYITQNTIDRVGLSDGSIVWMNRDSKIEYPNKFRKKERVIYLNGEAFFEVNPDSDRPFTVYTPATEIRVLGTKFNVKAYPGGMQEFITVMSGTVTVRNKSDTSTDSDTLFTGETKTIDKHNGQVEKHQNEDPNYLSWKTKRLEFKDTPLIDVVRILEEIYGYKIILQSTELDSVGLNAIYEDMDFHILMKTITLTLDLDIVERHDTVLISLTDD